MTFKMSRRTLLQGRQALSPSRRCWRSVSDARQILPLVAPGMKTPIATLSPNFKGGRSQVNLNFLNSNGDYPFLNLLKQGQNWSLADNSGWPEPSTLSNT